MTIIGAAAAPADAPANAPSTAVRRPAGEVADARARDDRVDGGGFAVRTSWVGRVAVVHCVGALDAAGAPALDHAVGVALAERPTGLVLDLGDLRHLETVGLRTVLSTQHRARAVGCATALASIPSQVAEFLRRLCVDRSLTSYPTVLEAARALVSACAWR